MIKKSKNVDSKRHEKTSKPNEQDKKIRNDRTMKQAENNKKLK